MTVASPLHHSVAGVESITLTVLTATALTVWCPMAAGQESPKPGAQAPDVHPGKALYAEAASWPATAPGSVSLKNFRPFRAVYDREYRQHSGANAGDARRDRVILSAEEVAWDGRRAVAITLLDSATPEHPDTNARALVQISDLETLQLLFEVGPIPGKAKDYYLARVEPEEILLNMVTTDTQKLTPQRHEISAPGFGPGTWVMASMDLEAETRIRLAPYYSPEATNLVSASSYGRVLGSQSITDGSGGEHAAWVVETGGYYSPSNPKVQHLYLIDRPPYYLGTENVHLETGDRSRFVWLREVQLLGDESGQP